MRSLWIVLVVVALLSSIIIADSDVASDDVKLAESGDVEAMLKLADLAEKSQDTENLLNYLQQAAASGSALAQHRLGTRYLSTDPAAEGSSETFARGHELLQTAAARNFTPSMVPTFQLLVV